MDARREVAPPSPRLILSPITFQAHLNLTRMNPKAVVCSRLVLEANPFLGQESQLCQTGACASLSSRLMPRGLWLGLANLRNCLLFPWFLHPCGLGASLQPWLLPKSSSLADNPDQHDALTSPNPGGLAWALSSPRLGLCHSPCQVLFSLLFWLDPLELEGRLNSLASLLPPPGMWLGLCHRYYGPNILFLSVVFETIWQLGFLS